MQKGSNQRITQQGKIGIWINGLLGLAWIVGLTGCSLATQLPDPTETNIASIPLLSATPTLTDTTAALRPESFATLDIPTPSLALTRPSRRTSTPTPTPTPTLPVFARSIDLPFVRDGEDLSADLAVISPENLSQLTELARWGKGEIITLAYAPDESQVAVVTSQGVYFYDNSSYELVRFVALDIYEPVAISPSLRYLAIETRKGHVEMKDLQSGQLLWRAAISENFLQSIAFTPDESRLYASDDEKTNILDTETGQPAVAISYGADKIIFSADGRTWVTSQDGLVSVWREDDPASPREIATTAYSLHAPPLAISIDGELLAIESEGDWEAQIAIWQVSDGSLLQIFSMQGPYETGTLLGPSTAFKVYAIPPRVPSRLSGPGRNTVSGIAFSPDGKNIAALNGFGLLHQWLLEDGALLRVTPTDNGNLIYSPTGKDLATWKHTASLYSAQSRQANYILGNHVGYISDLEFAPDNRTLMAASKDGKVWWRSAGNGSIIRTFKTQQSKPPSTYFTNAISDLDLAGDGSLLVAGTGDGQVYLWSMPDGESQMIEPSCEWGVWVGTVEFSYDNQYLALQTSECEIEIIRLKDKNSQPLSILSGYAFIPLTFSPTQPWVATSSKEGVEIFNVSDLIPVAIFGNAKTGKYSLLFSDDGQLLATGNEDETFDVWKISDSSLILSGKASVDRFAFSPDSRLLAISEGWRITLYDLSSKIELGRLYSRGSAIDFSPDGKLLAVGGDDGVVYIYGVPTGE